VDAPRCIARLILFPFFLFLIIACKFGIKLSDHFESYSNSNCFFKCVKSESYKYCLFSVRFRLIISLDSSNIVSLSISKTGNYYQV
jgi:hypothetical protein